MQDSDQEAFNLEESAQEAMAEAKNLLADQFRESGAGPFEIGTADDVLAGCCSDLFPELWTGEDILACLSAHPDLMEEVQGLVWWRNRLQMREQVGDALDAWVAEMIANGEPAPGEPTP